MRQEVSLFISNKEVEFTTPPEILYNYTETDLRNPTVIKNSYSKTITIDGTPNNNALFGEIWNMERVQLYKEGSTGPSYNPLQKADFKIYVNGELYESGYVKLNDITNRGGKVQYEISLFGGLGQFFYNLSYTHNEAGETVGPDKLQLKDLNFYFPKGVQQEGMVTDWDFIINKDTVFDAWKEWYGVFQDGDAAVDRPYTYDAKHYKWRYIMNFAPTLNGVPENFGADKVLINHPESFNGLTNSSGGYGTVDGFALGTAVEKMTCDQTFDMRSYLQRPVISMRAIIEACTYPENNGGYEVKLGEHFFNDANPYYTETWMTLPLLNNMEDVTTTETIITGATISASGNTAQKITFTKPTGTTLNNFQVTIDARFTLNSTPSYYPDKLFTDTYFTGDPTPLQDGAVKEYKKRGTQMLQLIAFDDTNTPIAESNVIMLQSVQYNGNTINNTYSAYKGIWNAYFPSDVPVPAIEVQQGCYRHLSGNIYYWTEGAATTAGRRGVTFTFSQPMQNFHHLVLKHLHPAKEWWKTRDWLIGYHKDDADYPADPIGLFSSMRTRSTLSLSLDEARARDRYKGNYSFSILNFEAVTTTYENFFSGQKITKDKLLATDNTPAQYLIDYCKLFGLYFYRDASEKSSDPEKYPNGVIHILDRAEFYHFTKRIEDGLYNTWEDLKPEVVNLEKLIDRSREIKITPQIPATKWYNFNVEQLESDADKKYYDTYEVHYGLKRVNTGYNFDAEATDVYNGNLFRGAPMVQEKDKYFYAPVDGCPVYAYNGFKYNLFKGGTDGYDSTELNGPNSGFTKVAINKEGLLGYDAFPKVQLHGPDNKAIDGDGVLLFGFNPEETPLNSGVTYFISDDIDAMGALNDETPCWVMTKAVRQYELDRAKVISALSGTGVNRRIDVYYGDSTSANANINLGNIGGALYYNGNPTANSITTTWKSDDRDVCFREYDGKIQIFHKKNLPLRFVNRYTGNEFSPIDRGNDSSYTMVSYFNDKVAYPIDRVPIFSRLVVNYGTKYSALSLDFGNPNEVFIPDAFNSAEQSIYYRFWKNYVEDLYSVDTRKLTCYVRIDNKPNPAWLRRFYWFDNSIWMLNKIVDWSVSKYEPTQMEFIKVQDINNYNLDLISCEGEIMRVTFDQDVIPWNDVEAYGQVYRNDAGYWSLDNDGGYFYIEYLNGVTTDRKVTDDINPYNGEGQLTTPFTVYVGENPSGMPRTITLMRQDCNENNVYYSFKQEGNGNPYVGIVCPTKRFIDGESYRCFTASALTKTEYHIPFVEYGMDNLHIYSTGALITNIYLEDDIVVEVESASTTDNDGRVVGTITLQGKDEFGNLYEDTIRIYQPTGKIEFGQFPSWDYNDTSRKMLQFSKGENVKVSWDADDPDGAFDIGYSDRFDSGYFNITPKAENNTNSAHTLEISVRNSIYEATAELTQQGDPPATYANVWWPQGNKANDDFYQTGGTSVTTGAIASDGRVVLASTQSYGHAYFTSGSKFKVSCDSNTYGAQRSFTIQVISAKTGRVLAKHTYYQNR